MNNIERRTLGQTGMTPKALGIGCVVWQRQEFSTQTQAGVRRAIDLGLDYIDTSAGYGESERRVGLALANGYRDKIYLQTKAGTSRSPRNYSAKTTRWSVEIACAYWAPTI